VAVATLKLDGLFFLLGALAGIGVFSETFPAIEDFWLHAGALGPLQIPEVLGLPWTWVVFGVAVMAVGVFIVVGRVERSFREEDA
jgi:hypothetical protein